MWVLASVPHTREGWCVVIIKIPHIATWCKYKCILLALCVCMCVCVCVCVCVCTWSSHCWFSGLTWVDVHNSIGTHCTVLTDDGRMLRLTNTYFYLSHIPFLDYGSAISFPFFLTEIADFSSKCFLTSRNISGHYLISNCLIIKQNCNGIQTLICIAHLKCFSGTQRIEWC